MAVARAEPPARSPAEASRVAAVTSPTRDFLRPEVFESNQAGAATSNATPNEDAFSHPSANMSLERRLMFSVGDGVFRKFWVSAPSSTTSSDGLGPLFNARACQSCHLRDGRGRPPEPGEEGVSMFLRLSVPPRTDAERVALADGRAAAIPEPTYGGQLQNFAVQGVAAEGRMAISHEEVPVTLVDGEVVELRRPTYRVTDLAYGPLAPDAMLSPRVTPPMIGLGLLEAVPEADILAAEDPEDRDGDGISGVAGQVWSDALGRIAVGRFGWKAGQATLADQTAHAFAGDIGISSPLVPAHAGDCTRAQADCRAAPHGADGEDGTEIGQALFDLVVFYAGNLAVPARRDVDDRRVLDGKRLFYGAGCASCHRPKFVTARDDTRPEQSFQLIWPYTDLLLHDMGDGLADDRPEGRASGREWRTPPLWGIGLTETVSGHAFLLHDGRARGVLEAILWHGGEAQEARDRVVAMSKAERDALLAFLRSL
ncbi:MAG: di-heme oxidoredictase family protein [Alphaproteobacteria bacterium]